MIGLRKSIYYMLHATNGTDVRHCTCVLLTSDRFCHAIDFQESRLKRDQFLNQMSSFLEGIESNTADIVPPEPLVSLASVESLTALGSRSLDQPRPSPESSMVEHVVDKQSLWPNASEDGPHGASLAFPPEASKIPFLNSSVAGPGSSLMREDLPGEPMVICYEVL